MKKIVIAASYFGINLGDEAILEAIIKSIYHIRKDIKITVLAWDVKKVREFHYDLFKKFNIKVLCQPGGKFQIKELFNYFLLLRAFLSIALCNYFIWGGGGIINDEGYFLKYYLTSLKIASLLKKKIFVFAIGVNFIKNKKLSRKIKKYLSKAHLISVRDEKSMENLNNMGVKKEINVVADPVFFLENCNPGQFYKKETSQFIVGVNLRPWFDRIIHSTDEVLKMDKTLDNLANIFLELKKELNFQLILIPFDLLKDVKILKILKDKLGSALNVELCDKINSLDELKNIMQKLDFFIGMRLHSIIFALRGKIPFFLISYTEKTNNLIILLNLRYNFISIKKLADISDLNYLVKKIKYFFCNQEVAMFKDNNKNNSEMLIRNFLIDN